jgi:lipoprotein-releasing system permease protein
MARPFRQTVYHHGFVAVGALLALGGAVALGLFVDRARAAGETLFPELDLALVAIGWGPLLELVSGLGRGMIALVHVDRPLPGPTWLLAVGCGLWTAGWVLVALGVRRAPALDEPPSAATSAPLLPALARYVDFHWGTLAAYGGGILAAEILFILVHTGLAGPVGLPPPLAFAFALLVGFGMAFAAGFAGAANGGRLSVPEATVGLVYLGLPIPILLTLRHYVPGLQLAVGEWLREVTHVAELLGRPEASYWLVFGGLVLVMVLGITSGFVATGSGRVDLRTGFELFVARRHVMVFRPRLLLGTLAVLLLGIIPPLLVLAVIRATEAAVERTRIKRLGQQDPLRASEAMHAAKLNEQTPTMMMTALSVGGVGVGVMALIIVLSVMSGFEQDLRQKILGTNAHGVVLKYGLDTFTEHAEVMEKIKPIPQVVGMTPFILNEVMISSEGDISGTVIKGIDPSTVGTVTDLPANIMPGGSLDYLVHPEKILEARERRWGGKESPETTSPFADDEIIGDIIRTPAAEPKGPVLPGIILGKELAANLKAVVGDRVNVVSPLGGELGPHGPMPKSRPFRVAGIFYSGMYEYDSKFVYISLREAQDFFGLKGVSGIELKLRDIDDARRVMGQINNRLGGYPYRTRDWGEMNKNLFSALRLEKLVMGIILSIIVIVAAGLIVATVIMLVLEKRKEIAVLKALGVPDGGIVKIFLAEGLQIGVAGGVLGLVSGLAWCLFIERVGIKLDPEVYYIPALPVKIEPLQTAIPVIIAVLVTYLASIYPALKASRVEPVEGLKAE